MGSGQAYTFNEVVGTINDFLGKNVKAEYIVKPVNYLENTLANITKMKTLLGINPVGLSEGLDSYLNERPEYYTRIEETAIEIEA